MQTGGVQTFSVQTTSSVASVGMQRQTQVLTTVSRTRIIVPLGTLIRAQDSLAGETKGYNLVNVQVVDHPFENGLVFALLV